METELLQIYNQQFKVRWDSSRELGDAVNAKFRTWIPTNLLLFQLSKSVLDLGSVCESQLSVGFSFTKSVVSDSQGGFGSQHTGDLMKKNLSMPHVDTSLVTI